MLVVDNDLCSYVLSIGTSVDRTLKQILHSKRQLVIRQHHSLFRLSTACGLTDWCHVHVALMMQYVVRQKDTAGQQGATGSDIGTT